MEVYEIKLKIYTIKDIKSEDSLDCISELIDKSFLKNKSLSNFHEENTFKNYVHNSFFPIETSKLYKAGNIIRRIMEFFHNIKFPLANLIHILSF